MRLLLRALTPEAFACLFQLSGWKQASALAEPRDHAPLPAHSQGEEIDFNEKETSSASAGGNESEAHLRLSPS